MPICSVANRRHWRIAYGRCVLWFFNFQTYFFGLRLCSRFSGLNQFYIVFWLLWIASTASYSTRYIREEAQRFTLSIVVNKTLFYAQLGAHAVVLLETLFTRKRQRIIRKSKHHIAKQLHRDGQAVRYESQLAWVVHCLLLPMIVTHSVVAGSVINCKESNMNFYWRSLPTEIALQLKLLGLLIEIWEVNKYLDLLQGKIQVLSTRNWQPFYEMLLDTTHRFNVSNRLPQMLDNETQLVANLKSVYSDIFRLYAQLNTAHGFSLLSISIVFFLELIYNIYEIIRGILQQASSGFSLSQNVVLVLNVMLLPTAVCWHCQLSYNYSRCIGCLIGKLAKPMGNKRYNDLVSEFSLQILHQRFAITAKDFFSLNLQLLGSMVAAIVTYLVILVQFMVAEKNGMESIRLHSNATNSTIKPMT